VRGAADGPQDPGITRHLAFQTDDLDGFLAAAAGVPVSLGPLSFDEVINGWRSVWLTDPDGLVVEVSEGYRDDAHLERHAAAHAAG
jgi:glyoxylase I family protein